MSESTTDTGHGASTGSGQETYDLEVSRLIPATPDEVFDAYTDAEKAEGLVHRSGSATGSALFAGADCGASRSDAQCTTS